MKLMRVTILLVKSYLRGCKDSFDEEGYSICKSWLILKKQNKLLKEYAKHDRKCELGRFRLNNSKIEYCTCGFVDVLK